jgi:hypothetical protein
MTDRHQSGRFAPGNQAAAGHKHPHATRVFELREGLFSAVTLDDVRDVVKALVTQAKSGDLDAIKVLLDRLFGRPGAALDGPELVDVEPKTDFERVLELASVAELEDLRDLET